MFEQYDCRWEVRIGMPACDTKICRRCVAWIDRYGAKGVGDGGDVITIQ